MTKYIFVVGGVISGVGKGIATSSIAKILQDYDYKVTTIKIDPYVNIDAGTMNPIEHGEVFVTDDGLESDQDLGNYERFLNEDMHRINYMTTGMVYESVIHKERNLEYKGKCVEVVPHIPEEIIHRIETCAKKTKADFVLIEIGGTVGEYQNLLFLEAGRMMKLKYPEKVIFIMVSYLPIPDKIGEMKTKPTQHAVRTLNSSGIQPEIIIARARVPLDKPRKTKIAIFCNIKEEDVISAPDIQSIYEVPVNFEKDGLGERIIKNFGLKARKNKVRAKKWEEMVKNIRNIEKPSNKKVLKIATIGKYFTTGDFILSDSYISVIEAIKHAAWQAGYRPVINWIDSEIYEKNPKKLNELLNYNGIIVPGGFGMRGVEGKIKAIQFSRENNIPYFGLCYGMQLAVIEVARHLAGMKNANTTEINPDTPFPVIDLAEDQKENIKNSRYGGSMRLGSFPCEIKKESVSFRAYKEKTVLERHRHRYELNNDFKDKLEKAGLMMAGVNRERNLVEIVEFKNHPFFVGVQFHPEFKSRPLQPHPLFKEFIRACLTAR
ncbi:MAG: CTP synthase [Candidatus Terrybacteria bacterium]|nr:CTP synthase [Candidatus Terrybacteria bacterium]